MLGIMRGAVGSRILAFMGALSIVGCGGGDDGSGSKPPNPNCGTVQNPKQFELSGLQPAIGASVPNTNITHQFTITASVVIQQLVTAYTPAHTAGDPTPALAWTAMPVAGGVTYQSNSVAWANTPAQVEIESEGIYQAPDGCVYKLPTPLFSYNLTQ
jgi:hypothetical protein